MADLPSTVAKMNDVEINTDAPMTETLWRKIGSSVNGLIDRLIVNANVDPAAAIARSKLANGAGGESWLSTFTCSAASGTFEDIINLGSIIWVIGRPVHITISGRATGTPNQILMSGGTNPVWRLEIVADSTVIYFTESNMVGNYPLNLSTTFVPSTGTEAIKYRVARAGGALGTVVINNTELAAYQP